MSMPSLTAPAPAAAPPARRRPLNRRFIVVEGIYANSGDLAPLDRIKPLKEVRAGAGGGVGGGYRAELPS